MKILVTGGVGYIGSRTCALLMQAGHDIAELDNVCNSSAVALDWLWAIAGRPLHFAHGDIRNRDDFGRAF